MKKLLIIFLLFWSSIAFAQDAGFLEGLGAYKARNYNKALEIWEPLAKEGNVEAQFNLGTMYRQGLGVPQDPKKAVEWYKKAAELGNASAQNNLGFLLDEGLGIPEDDKEAVRWYSLAAKQGNAYAQYNLGIMYNEGKAVLKSDTQAYIWLNIAEANGVKDAQKIIELISKKLTKDNLQKARQLSVRCLDSSYEDCN